jgi:signal transduction histidine kinase
VRARLLVIVLVVVGLVAVGLGGLLAWTTAQAAQQGFFTRRLTDTVYLASLVQRPLTEAEAGDLAAVLDRYRQVYGVTVHVVAADGTPFAPSAAPALDADGRERLDAALAGRRSPPPPLQMPWDGAPLVVAEPVLVDGEVRGAVVTDSPTAALRRRELETWGLITVAVLCALGLGVLVSLPVVRWILHPVRRLDEGTGRVAAAVLAGGAAAPVADDSGPPELRRLSASFDRMAETVTGALAAQRAFVADASHQLRNPLTALRLRLSNVSGHVDAAATDDHVAALEEAERLSTLLDGLLALARTERAAPLADVDVDAAVGDRVEAWRPLAEHAGLHLRHDGARGLSVLAPVGAVEAVLDAVLDNAVKFSASSGASSSDGRGGSITVRTAARDGHVEIGVRDTGPGIPPDELDRATDRFWRSPAQSNVEGSGLGLAIAVRTLELAGGTLRLERPEGGGLRVVARLPGSPGGGADGAGPPT